MIMNSKYQVSRGTVNTTHRRAGGGERPEAGGRGEETSCSLFSEQNGGCNIH